MRSLNKAMIIGHLGNDPDVRYTPSNTAVANFSVATSERYKDAQGEWQEKTQWHRIVAWNRLAEIAQQYLKKGSQVYIEGPIETRSWEGQDGQTRYTTEIKALTLIMLDSRGDMQGGAPSPAGQSMPQSASKPDTGASAGAGAFDDVDDDLPF